MLEKLFGKKLWWQLVQFRTELQLLKAGISLPMWQLLWTATADGRNSVIYRELRVTMKG